MIINKSVEKERPTYLLSYINMKGKGGGKKNNIIRSKLVLNECEGEGEREKGEATGFLKLR